MDSTFIILPRGILSDQDADKYTVRITVNKPAIVDCSNTVLSNKHASTLIFEPSEAAFRLCLVLHDFIQHGGIVYLSEALPGITPALLERAHQRFYTQHDTSEHGDQQPNCAGGHVRC